MTYPYAIVSETDGSHVLDVVDTAGARLQPITSSGLTILLGSGPTVSTPERFFDVVSAVAERVPTLPVRATDQAMPPDAAVRTLRAGGSRFEELLTSLGSCWEWSIELGEDGPTTPPAPSTGSDGHRYLAFQQERLHEGIGLTASQSRTARALVHDLRPLLHDHRVLFSPTTGASLALLVADVFGPMLEERFADVAPAAAPSSALIGPWPAFSFVGNLDL